MERSPRQLLTVHSIGMLCIGFLAGVLFARFVPSEVLISWVWYAVCGLILMPLFYVRQSYVTLVCILIIGIFMGYIRGNSEMYALRQVTHFYNSVVTMRGLVADDIGSSKQGRGIIKLTHATIHNKKVHGTFWVAVSKDVATKIKRSDRVALTGMLQPGFGAYTGVIYRATVTSVGREDGRDPLLQFRDQVSGGIYRQLPEREAALGAGYVLGQNNTLSSDFDEALRTVGLTHVVVASGYNLTILVRLARRVFAKISRYVAAISGGAMAALFIGVTGMSPSMNRAGLVAGLSLLAWYYGRQLHPVIILLVSATLSVLVQPSYIWGDIGWLLSFTAFAGVMFLAPVLQAYFFGDKPAGVVRQILCETLAAQIYTAPIILVVFNTFSTVALIANILVLPFVPLAMILVFITGVAEISIPSLASLAAMPTHILMSYMTYVIDTLSSISWASFTYDPPWYMVIAGCVSIGGITFWLYRKSDIQYRKVNLIE